MDIFHSFIAKIFPDRHKTITKERYCDYWSGAFRAHERQYYCSCGKKMGSWTITGLNMPLESLDPTERPFLVKQTD